LRSEGILHHPAPTYSKDTYLIICLAIFPERKRRAPCGTRRPSSPSNQPQRFLAVAGNGVRSCFTQPFFPVLNFYFCKSQLANFLPMTESMVNVGQTARLPMLRVFRKIEPKETGCRLLPSCI
jgi:hypothetical protein